MLGTFKIEKKGGNFTRKLHVDRNVQKTSTNKIFPCKEIKTVFPVRIWICMWEREGSQEHPILRGGRGGENL